jgi:hypothetical protein
VLKDVSVIGAPVHDVMPSAGEIDTRSARHGSEASERIVISFWTISEPRCQTRRV